MTYHYYFLMLPFSFELLCVCTKYGSTIGRKHSFDTGNILNWTTSYETPTLAPLTLVLLDSVLLKARPSLEMSLK